MLIKSKLIFDLKISVKYFITSTDISLGCIHLYNYICNSCNRKHTKVYSNEKLIFVVLNEYHYSILSSVV